MEAICRTPNPRVKCDHLSGWGEHLAKRSSKLGSSKECSSGKADCGRLLAIHRCKDTISAGGDWSDSHTVGLQNDSEQPTMSDEHPVECQLIESAPMSSPLLNRQPAGWVSTSRCRLTGGVAGVSLRADIPRPSDITRVPQRGSDGLGRHSDAFPCLFGWKFRSKIATGVVSP